MAGKETTKGTIDEIRFRNDENGYTILTLETPDGEPVVCVGMFPPVSEGETLEIEGAFVFHPRFGRQFRADRIKSVRPDTLDGLVRYLGSGLLKGVGPKTALAIVDKFKENTIEVLEYKPYLLSAIRGINAKKAQEIGLEFAEIKNMREAVTFLQLKNISAKMAVKIYKIYGDKTIAAVSANPYMLIEDIDGIGFLTADKIALEMGIERDSPQRINAGILTALSQSGERNGNTFLPAGELTAEAARLLSIDESAVSERIDGLVLSAKLKKVSDGETEGYALAATFRIEKSAAVGLVRLIERGNRLPVGVHEEIAEFERQERIVMHEAQKAAVAAAVQSGAVVITGGPGTGKTTIIKCILNIFDKNNITCSLLASTGRAAKRLSESTSREASTIHRALMISPGGTGGGEPLTSGAVIVDEFSMVDIFLFNSLISRLTEGVKLIMVGDKDQLPSVGAGNVLADIMKSGCAEVINLTKIYRQSDESLITINAHAINNGEMPKLFEKSGDFFFTKTMDASETAKVTVDLAAERIPKFLGCEPSRVQILSPVKNGLAGTISLNLAMQARLNGGGHGKEIECDEARLKVGDRVMHTANNYSLSWRKTSGYYVESGEGVFNGDLGTVSAIRHDSGEVDVLFEDGREATYTADIRNQLILAYAITVHKSQGSEFDGVVMPVLPGSPVIMTRNLLYTAITRAKKIVILVGEEYNIKRMVDNNYIAKRYSMLGALIAEAKKKIDILYGGQEEDFE